MQVSAIVDFLAERRQRGRGGGASRSAEELAEAAERAKDFSRRKMKEHREAQARLSARRRAAREALSLLPPALRALALAPDNATYPMPDWPVQTDTAPLAMLGLEANAAAEGEPKESVKRFGRKGRRAAKNASS